VWEKLDDPLFLEEERERELERLYDENLAETMNRDNDRIGIGRGADGVDSGETQEQVEVAQVTKQTTETLLAGEKIMEAIDVADADLALLAEFEAAKSGLNDAQVSALPSPARNPLLAMQGLEAEVHVLRVIEKVSPTALQDALLVLPFNNVLSLMRYLNEWARRVRICLPGDLAEPRVDFTLIGVEHCPRFAHPFLHPPNTPSPDRCKSRDAHDTHSVAETPTRCTS
jgi:U3 small nucleolar RNA-associated protein 12